MRVYDLCVYLMTETLKGSTKSGSMEKPGIEPATPTLFVAFLGINQFRRVGLKFMLVFYNGNTQRLTESFFMEKPGIKPATPGLQGIALIHYTTAASPIQTVSVNITRWKII